MLCERLRELDLFTLEGRRLRGNLIKMTGHNRSFLYCVSFLIWQSIPSFGTSPVWWVGFQSAVCSHSKTLALTSQVFTGPWGMLAVSGTSTLWGVRLKVQALNILLLLRGTVDIRLLITHWICVVHQWVGVYISSHPRSEHGANPTGSMWRNVSPKWLSSVGLSGPPKRVLLTC